MTKSGENEFQIVFLFCIIVSSSVCGNILHNFDNWSIITNLMLHHLSTWQSWTKFYLSLSYTFVNAVNRIVNNIKSQAKHHLVFIEVEIGEHYHYSDFYAILIPIKNHKKRFIVKAVFAEQTMAMNGPSLIFQTNQYSLRPVSALTIFHYSQCFYWAKICLFGDIIMQLHIKRKYNKNVGCQIYSITQFIKLKWEDAQVVKVFAVLLLPNRLSSQAP